MNFSKVLFFAISIFVCNQLFSQATTASPNNANTGTAPNPNEFLGSGSGFNYDIVFKTGGNERMRMLLNGNLGIGTTTPASKFHVTGHALFSTATGIPTSAPYILAKNGFSTASLADYTWYGNLTTGIFHPALNIIGFTISGSEKLRIHSNGFIGIGSTSPLFRAHVNGDLFVTGTGGGFPYGTIGSAGGATMYFGDTDTQPQWGVEYADPNITTGSIDGGLNFWRPAGANGIGGNYVLFLKNDSKIGIHTGTPTADLTVNGNMLVGDPLSVGLPSGYKLYVQTGILTEKVKVALYSSSDWSDYVFEKNYKLKKIEEVNEYILTNKHLPGIPSAQELVEQGGFDLGKMDAKLLEKIEELTLYIIKLNEENKQLSNRLLKLEASK